MFIYLVERTDHCDYDEYKSFLIVAESEEIARNAHPSDEVPSRGTWPVNPDELKVTKVGRPIGNIRGVIHSSFNAG